MRGIMKRYAMLGVLKLSMFLKKRLPQEYFVRYGGLLDKNITVEKLEELVHNYEIEYLKNEPTTLKDYRMQRLLSFCQGNRIAITCMELALVEYMDPTVGELFQLICPRCEEGITLEVAAKITYEDKAIFEAVEELWEAYNLLRIILEPQDLKGDYVHTVFKVNSKLIAFMDGVAKGQLALITQMDFFEHQAPLEKSILYTEEINEISRNIEALLKKEALNPVIHILGEKLSGKKFMVKHIAQQIRYDVLFFDWMMLQEGEEVSEINHRIREAFIFQAAICLDNIERVDNQEKAVRFIKHLLKEMEFMKVPIFIISNTTFRMAPFIDNQVYEFKMKKLTSLQSFKVWEAFSKNYLEEKQLNMKELSTKMNISIGYIEKIVKLLALSEEKVLEDHKVAKVCYQILDDGKYNSIKRVESNYQWEDLKLEEKEKHVLRDIYHQIIYKFKVFNDYGLKEQYPYGQGIAILFSGPPGTGKTMAVHVLANRLNLELFKVDLSQIVDKYIGETEKRLEDIFSKAEQSHMILFFDEADAIFGKRGEVNDPRDRYSNTEVSYILQRIEEFDGIVILATNYRNNIDSAFIRRIRYEVKFSLPSEAIRKEMWEAMFQSKVPNHMLDFDFLAHNFQLTGALIKNIAINAIFKAVAEEKPVSMTHIIGSIISEYEKMGKMIVAEEFGSYAYLV